MAIVFKRNYSASTAYSIDNIVRYTDGKTYISLADSNTGHTPGASGSESYWKELAGVKYNSDNPDWNENDSTKSSYIQNRPIIYKEVNNLTFADFGNNHDDFNEFTIDGTTYYPVVDDGHWLGYPEVGRVSYSVRVKDENDNEYYIYVDTVESSGEFISGHIHDVENDQNIDITSSTSYSYTSYQVNPAYKDFFDSLRKNSDWEEENSAKSSYILNKPYYKEGQYNTDYIKISELLLHPEFFSNTEDPNYWSWFTMVGDDMKPFIIKGKPTAIEMPEINGEEVSISDIGDINFSNINIEDRSYVKIYKEYTLNSGDAPTSITFIYLPYKVSSTSISSVKGLIDYCENIIGTNNYGQRHVLLGTDTSLSYYMRYHKYEYHKYDNGVETIIPGWEIRLVDYNNKYIYDIRTFNINDISTYEVTMFEFEEGVVNQEAVNFNDIEFIQSNILNINRDDLEYLFYNSAVYIDNIIVENSDYGYSYIFCGFTLDLAGESITFTISKDDLNSFYVRDGYEIFTLSKKYNEMIDYQYIKNAPFTIKQVENADYSETTLNGYDINEIYDNTTQNGISDNVDYITANEEPYRFKDLSITKEQYDENRDKYIFNFKWNGNKYKYEYIPDYYDDSNDEHIEEEYHFYYIDDTDSEDIKYYDYNENNNHERFTYPNHIEIYYKTTHIDNETVMNNPYRSYVANMIDEHIGYIENPNWACNDSDNKSYIQNRPLYKNDYYKGTTADDIFNVWAEDTDRTYTNITIDYNYYQFENNNDKIYYDQTDQYDEHGDFLYTKTDYTMYITDGDSHYRFVVSYRGDDEYIGSEIRNVDTNEIIQSFSQQYECYIKLSSNKVIIDQEYREFFDSLGGSGAGIDVDYETTDTQVVVTMTSGSNTATISFDLADIKEY